MSVVLDNFFNVAVLERIAPILLSGLGVTALLCLVVVPAGAIGGLSVALLYNLKRRWLQWALIAYVDFFRAFPPLVLLIFIFFGLPFLGIDIPALGSVAIAFLLNSSAYYGEIFRAGIESVGRGQTEAARSTGLGTGQTMAYVVLPQAIRNVAPDLIGNTLEVIKLTTLVSVVAVPDLLGAARLAQGLTYNATPVVAAALMYFVLLWPLVRILSRFEHKAIAAAG